MQYNTYRLIGAALLWVNISSNAWATPPINLTDEKIAIINYYQSAQFNNDVNEALKSAKQYMIQRVMQNKALLKPRKLAIVLDIDDTSLTNFYAFKKRDFTNFPAQISAGYRFGNLPAVKPVLDLYKKAINYGLHIFFISFRPSQFMKETQLNLQKAGYLHWDKIYLPNIKEYKQSPDIFKTKMRQEISKQGYTIVLNIGDQDTDFMGGYAEKISKIPNPLYNSNTVLSSN